VPLAFIETSYQNSLLRSPNETPLVGLVGWSRGEVIANWVARDLNPKNISVNFLGLFDPVDMSDLIPNIYAVSSNVELVRSIGPNESGMNWDYRDWPRVTPLLTAYEPTDLQSLYPDVRMEASEAL